MKSSNTNEDEAKNEEEPKKEEAMQYDYFECKTYVQALGSC